MRADTMHRGMIFAYLEANKTAMRRVTANDFSDGDWVDYSADGIRIINDITKIRRPDQDSVKIDMTIIVFCQSGRLNVTINNKEHILTAKSMLFLQPNSVVDNYSYSDDFIGKALAFSLQVIENTIYLRRKNWDNIAYLHLNPIVPLSDGDLYIYSRYYDIATANLKTSDSAYKREIINHLLRSMVYEFLLLTDRAMANREYNSSSVKQGTNDDLHHRFLELIAFSGGRMRKVNQYAEQLSVTPKQLLSAVQQVSGRTAIDWITESTVQAIINSLLYTNKTVSEIAYGLDFPSLSFFGKFFRKHTGLSPRAYRDMYGKPNGSDAE